jgi:diguanylate cyclase (GGDEF)-like protein
MDKFKTLNDTLGHDYGDQMLIEVAGRIKSCVREMDTVARLGGDEFVVLAEDAGSDEQDALRKVATVAEKIRETLARPYRLFDQEYQSSPSIGVALYHGNGETVDDLLRQADLAMYQVKKSGRNAICFFDASMQAASGSHDALTDDLGHALERGELHLWFQPQVDGERRTVGAEALLRWIHPQRGLVMPDDFIPAAEKSALILDIDRWVLNQACARLLRWAEDERTRRLTLAVNISARFFAQPGFIGEMTELLASHPVVPGLLIVETNERMVLEDLPGALAKMEALKDMGVSLSMDDFGSGYSSLTYLKQLPLDQLKICRTFVQGIEVDVNDTQLVQSILDLGQRFGLSVLAEGVETEAQFAFLSRHDCLSCQGFLFGQAVPVEQFEASLDV